MQQPHGGGFPRPLTSNDPFYRAIPPGFLREGGKISPAAFSKASANKKMSVDWGELSSPRETYDRWESWGEGRAVAALTAQACWDCQQTVEFAAAGDNPAHSEVGNSPDSAIGSDKVRFLLAQRASLVLGPARR